MMHAVLLSLKRAALFPAVIFSRLHSPKRFLLTSGHYVKLRRVTGTDQSRESRLLTDVGEEGWTKSGVGDFCINIFRFPHLGLRNLSEKRPHMECNS